MPSITQPSCFGQVPDSFQVNWNEDGKTGFRVLVGPLPNNGNYVTKTNPSRPCPIDGSGIPTGWFTITVTWSGPGLPGYTSCPFQKV